MKPGKYDGKKSLDTFMAQFETCAVYNRWNSNDKCAFLKCALVDGPAQTLWDSGDARHISYDQLVERLRARYGSTGQAEKFRTELRSRRRRRGETLTELHGDIRRLMALAYPGLGQSDVCEIIARDHFIDAVGDRELELKLREREPADLDSTLRLAVRLEAYASANGTPSEEYQRHRRENDRGDEKLAKRVSQIESSMQQLRTRDNRNDTADEWRRKFEQLSKDYERVKYLEEQRKEGERAAGQRVVEQQATRPVAAPMFRRGEPPKCFGCGQPGHFKWACPNAPNASIPRTDEQRPTPERKDDKQSNVVRNATTSTADQRNREAYLRIRVNGEPCDCLLDTGSEVTLIPFQLVKGAAVTPDSQRLRAANGTSIPIVGRVSLMGAIGGQALAVDGLVTKHVSGVILGLGWLRQHQAVWYFDQGTVQLNGRLYYLQSRASAGWCCRVVVDETVTVPPLSEYDLSTNVVYNSLDVTRTENECVWATDIAEPVKGLLVSRTVVSNRADDVLVRVMNITKEPIQLVPGTVISSLEAVNPVAVDRETRTEEIQERVDVLRSLADQADAEVPGELRDRLYQLLVKYQQAFSFHENDLGRTGVLRHSIDTGDARPVRQALRRQPPAHQLAIKEHVASMLAQGVIEPAQSPWASNIVIVRKKDGTTRCCADYRQVNNLTRKDAYPLPRTDVCLDALSGARWFTTMDLRSSYHQVEVEPRDADKTAFICREGSYRFVTMPFGLCNAGATFQRLMDLLMSGLNFESCLVYLDDIVVFSSDLDQHLERLQQVLQRLADAGLKLKPNKCKFMKAAVDFLGHVVSADGISVDPGKISAVSDWPVPTNLTELRSYLGICGYYRRFVMDFSLVASPLYDLTVKNRPFNWTQECQQAFDKLKEKLTTAPILRMPNEVDTFILDTDASNFAIGAVLSQVVDGAEYVVAYASKRLSRCEKNYCVTRRELLAIVYFVKYFRHYILGRHFQVRTDHAALQWLRRMPDPCGQQARWIGALEQFDFEILHRPGARHGNADAMSRRPCDRKRCCPPAGRIAPTDIHSDDEHECAAVDRVDSDDCQDQPALDGNSWASDDDFENMGEEQLKDTDIAPIYSLVSDGAERPQWDDVAHLSGTSKALWQQWTSLQIVNGILCRSFESAIPGETRWQMVIPRRLRRAFIVLAHQGITGGHLGRKRTEASVRNRAYWPGWTEDIRLALGCCEQCVKYHRGSAPKTAALKPFPAGDVWETVSLDITGPHPRSKRGYVFILTVMDHFSKWAEALPLRNHTAPVVAKALFDHVLVRFGTPRRILTDQGAEFESELFRQLCQMLEISKVRCSPYRPSTNGMLERFHRSLNSMLAKVVDSDQKNWCEKLPGVVAAYRGTVHDTTGFSPNRLMFGRENRTPLDLVYGRPAEAQTPVNVSQYVLDLENKLQACYELVRQHTGAAVQRRKDRYDTGVKPSAIGEGCWAWYFYPRRRVGLSPKWQSWYTGPYKILKLIDGHRVVIQRSKRAKPLIVHRDKLKMFCGDPPTDWDICVAGRGSVPRNVVDDETSVEPHETRRRPVRRRRRRDASPGHVSPVDSSRRHCRPRRYDDYVCA
ncbi:MAG: RNase H-like domain-containing protein [Flavobacteriaceae bacterium]|nr:RNase H-like domain-containing protein [Flavobacteriaceae bacterium]